MHPPEIGRDDPGPDSGLERAGELRIHDPARQKWRRWAIRLALAAAIFAMGWVHADSVDSAVRAGSAIADVAISFGVAALFLGWKRSWRPWIPWAALGFAGWMLTHSTASRAREASEQAAALKALIDRFQGGDSVAAAPSAADSIPVGGEARMLWATRMALLDLVVPLRAAAGEAPPGWLSPAYIADAGTHPEVERYLGGLEDLYVHFASTLRSGLPPRLHARLLQAHFIETEAREIERRELIGVESALTDSANSFAEIADFVRAARTLHAYLVSIDGRVRYDRAQNQAIFARDSELSRTNALFEELWGAQARLKAARRTRKQEVVRELDSVFGLPRGNDRENPRP